MGESGLSLKLGVVIVAHNSQALLKDCVDFLRSDSAESASAEVWVVDSGSFDGSLPNADEVRADRLLLAPNYGYGISANLAVANGLRADWYVIMNPDARISLNELSSLISLAERGGAGIAAPALDQSLPHGHFLRVPKPPWRHVTSYDGVLDEKRGVQLAAAQGSIIAISRHCFSDLGGFDTSYFLYFEEIDLCVRARAMGYAVSCFPAVIGWHAGKSSSSGVPRLWRDVECLRGKLTFYRKHYSGFEARCLLLIELVARRHHIVRALRQLSHDPHADLPWPPRAIGFVEECT
jgi:N-acetylglucosaminyl-diphospho-decaprenol L-rhamnosyltransferase